MDSGEPSGRLSRSDIRHFVFRITPAIQNPRNGLTKFKRLESESPPIALRGRGIVKRNCGC